MNLSDDRSHWKRGIGAALLVLVYLCFTGCDNIGNKSHNSNRKSHSDRVTGPSPRLSLTESELSFGRQDAGIVLERSVTVINSGTADLIIKKAMGVGSQISVQHPQDPIKPGQTGELKIRFDTRGRSGEQRRRIVIISNDPIEPRQYLSLNADLDLLLGVKPRRVWFGNVSGKESVTGIFSLTGSNIGSLDPNKIECTAEHHKDLLRFEIDDDRQGTSGDITVNVTLNPTTMEPGQFNIPVAVRTNHSTQQSLRVMLTGNLMGPLRTTPSRLYFGRYESGIPMSQTITVNTETMTAFTITSVYTNSKMFTVTQFTDAVSTSAEITVTFLADDTAEPRNRGVLTIETDVSDHGKIEIPMYAFRKVEKEQRM